jgi:hypothetical protein
MYAGLVRLVSTIASADCFSLFVPNCLLFISESVRRVFSTRGRRGGRAGLRRSVLQQRVRFEHAGDGGGAVYKLNAVDP